METMTIASTYRQVREYKREQRLARKFERQLLRETRKGVIKAARQSVDLDKLEAADFIFRCEDESPSFSPFD
jgi:hypothetical protein